MWGIKKRFAKWWERHERIFNLTSLVGGFLFDLALAKRPDSFYDNLLLISYLFLAAIIILALNVRSSRRRIDAQSSPPLALIFVLQFCFGGLASNLLILYGKSGTLSAGLFFITTLAAFALGNEFLKTRYDQLRFNVAIYYFLLLTYCIIAVPTFILHTIGTWAFIASGLVSLLVMGVIIMFLYLFAFRKNEKYRVWRVSMLISSILFVFSGLYFFNILPPVPLSLKEIGVYHTLSPNLSEGSGGTLYTGTYEKSAWYVFWRDTSSTYTIRTGEGAYCFSAVFAPGRLSTPIVHRWEKHDGKNWQTESTVVFPINGGREEGYRGWSYKDTLSSGQWRCNVETGKGQLVGRISFDVVAGTPTLSTTGL